MSTTISTALPPPEDTNHPLVGGPSRIVQMTINRRLGTIILVGTGLLFLSGVYLGVTVSWIVGSAPIGIAVIVAVPILILLLGDRADHPE